LAGVFALLALGKYNPIYRAAIEMMGMTALRNPSKFLFFAILPLSMLAAQGWHGIAELHLRGADLQKWVRRSGVLFGVILTGPAAAQAALAVIAPFWDKIKLRSVAQLLIEKAELAHPADEYLKRMDVLRDLLIQAVSYRNDGVWIQAVWACAAFLLVVLISRGGINRRVLALLAALILFADLTLFCRMWSTGFVGNAISVQSLKPSVELTRLIGAARDGGGRWAEFTSASDPEQLPPNAGMYYGLPMAGGYSPLLLKPYYQLTYDLGLSDGSLGRPESDRVVWKRERALLDLIGVRWIRSAEMLPFEGFEPSGGTETEFFYRNDRALPDALLYTDWTVLPGIEARLEFMKSAQFDAVRQAVVGELVVPGASQPGPAGVVRVIAAGDDFWELEARADRGGLLWVRNSFYPGWTVEADGHPLRTIRVNHAFMGAVLEPKEVVQKIHLRYRPFRSAWPAVISGFGCFLILILWAVSAVRMVFAKRGIKP
jgi:hypothetical protein